MAAPAAYESSQARGQIRAAARAYTQPQQHGIQGTYAIYTKADSNARSLTLS